MKYKKLSIFLYLMFMVSSAAASLSELETAIIAQDYQKAKTMAAELLRQNPPASESNEIRFYLGLSHLRLGEYDEAEKAFNELLALSPEDVLRDKVYLGLFNVHYLNEDYKEALRVIEKLHALSPNSSFASMIYLKMARVNLKLTNWQKASEYLKRIIQEYPESTEVHTAKQLLEERQYFAVQIGAFLDRRLAEKQVEELRQKNEYAYIVETLDKDNRKFYRVRVGQMTLLDDARELEDRLSNLGYPTEIYP